MSEVTTANKVEIRPLEKDPWHGKKGKESFSRPIKLKVLVSSDRMEYATGLTPEEARIYGEKLGLDLSPQFNPEKPHPFWDSNAATLTLPNYPIFYDLSNPLDFVKYKAAKAHSYIANSQKEYDEGFYPHATHVIFDESEEVDIKATKVAVKTQAIIEASALSKEKKIELILLLEGKLLKGKSDNTVNVELDQIIEKKPKEVLAYLQMNSEDRSLQSLVAEALFKGVLHKEGHKILYHDSYLGSDILDVVLYFKDVENHDLKLRILQAVTE